MRLYLVQHGEALPEQLDPERPLSDRGRVDVERMASFLARAGVRIPCVLHSGKLRAQQTAELLAASLGAAGGAERSSGISPLDPTDAFAQTVHAWTEDTMVIGHLPFMGKLVSRLVRARKEIPVVAYQPGSVACLERTDEGDWSIIWMIRPELIRSFSEGAP